MRFNKNKHQTFKKKKGGRSRSKQNWAKNEGYFGPIMDKKGKLDREEICRYCNPSEYAKGARMFCKLHDKVWHQKSNSCKSKKKKTRKKKKRSTKRKRR